MNENDPDYSRGARQPGAFPGRAAWQNIQAIRSAALRLQKLLGTVLIDCEAKTHCLGQVDAAAAFAEILVLRFDRNGPPVDQTELNDMEATLRLAHRYPDHFKAFDVGGLKKQADALRKKGGAT